MPNVKKFQWVAYGLDMFGCIIVETEGTDMNDSHKKAVGQLKQNGIDFDTVEPFDNSFIKRMKWLNN